jgi:hypothetical protein
MTAKGGRAHDHHGFAEWPDTCGHCNIQAEAVGAAQPSESEREGAAVRRIQEPAGVRTACDGCSAESSDLIRISPTEGDPVHLCIGCAVQVATSVQDLVAPPSPPSTGQPPPSRCACWCPACGKQMRACICEPSTGQSRERLEEALDAVRPSCRARGCWCPAGWDTSQAHSVACEIARRALESKP